MSVRALPMPRDGRPRRVPAHRPAWSAAAVRRTALLAAALCLAAGSAGAAESVVATSGIWKTVRVEDPLADRTVRCEVRSALPGADGGRREQGRVRIDVTSGRVMVDAPVGLTHAVRLRRKVLDRRSVAGAEERTDLGDTVVHVLRVDEGTRYQGQVAPPVFEPWDATEAVGDVSAFVASLGSGKMLFYGWQLDPANETDRYDLAGFPAALDAARKACPD